MKICISEATTLTSSFAEDVAAYSGAGFEAMEVWFTKLETHLEKHTLQETENLLQDKAMKLAAASYQGGLLLSQGQQRQTHFDHFKRRLDLCQVFKIPTLLVVADFTVELDHAALQRAVVSLREVSQWAEGYHTQIAIEFRGKNTFCSCLETAVSLVSACDEKNVTVALDVFHYYTGCSKFEDLKLLTQNNLGHVQVCDLSGVPRELATDADRIFPGEGDFVLTPIIQHLDRINYQGWVSLELMNPMIWKNKCSTVAEMAFLAMRRLLDPTGKSCNP